MGQPLNLPPCGSGTFAAPTQVCQVTGGGMMDAFTRIAATGNLMPEAPGLAEVTVRLPASRCADWADCSLVVSLKGGYAMAVTFLTRYGAERQDEVIALLSEKYGRAPVTSGESVCSVSMQGVKLGVRDRAPNRLWDLDGIAAGYLPYGSAGSCAFGAVRVQLDAMSDLVQSEKSRERAAQPKM